MDSTRQNKFARLIQKEMGGIFLKKGRDLYGQGLVSVTGVKVSPDLGYVKIYLSVMGLADRQSLIDILNKHNKDLRKFLGEEIKSQIRHIPELSFFLDDSFDQAEKIDKILKTMNEPAVLPDTVKKYGKKS